MNSRIYAILAAAWFYSSAVLAAGTVLNDGSFINNLTRIGNSEGTSGATSSLAVTKAGTNSFILASQSPDFVTFPMRAGWWARDRFPTTGVYTVSADFQPADLAAERRGGVLGWINIGSSNAISFQVRPADPNAGFQVGFVDFTTADSSANETAANLFNLDGSPATQNFGSAWSSIGTNYNPSNFATLQLAFTAPTAQELLLVTNATAHITAKVFQGTNGQGQPLQVSTTIELLGSVPLPAASVHRVGYYAYWGTIRDVGGSIGNLDNLTLDGAIGALTNKPPIVTLTSPTDQTVQLNPSDVLLSATASDTDGMISQVEFFYNGTNQIGIVQQAPYQGTWTNVTEGFYRITAVAVDDSGARTTSSPPAVLIINTPPQVALTSPADSSRFAARTDIPFSATASDADGSVVKVDFYNSTSLIGSVTNTSGTASNFSFLWKNVPSGIYSELAAVATDNLGGTNISPLLRIFVDNNQPPNVSVLSPTNGTTVFQGQEFVFAADASDPDGTITRVIFTYGTNTVATITNPPYTTPVRISKPGTYELNATAFDNLGASKTSTNLVRVTVLNNQAPVVVLTAPTNNASYVAPATVTLTATASDPENALLRVDFVVGTNVVRSVTNAPFQITLTNLAAGTYSLSAVAVDAAGASTISSNVTVVVTGGTTVPPTIGFIQSGTQLTVSWPVGYLGYTLQTSTNIALGPWLDVAGSSTTNKVTLPKTGAQLFYRLVLKQVTAGSPALSLARSGNSVVVSWPVSATGYRLQATTNVAGTNWSVVTATNNQATVNPAGDLRFFRLIKP